MDRHTILDIPYSMGFKAILSTTDSHW